MTDYYVRQGGLMRCCLESLRLYLVEHEHEDIPEGTVIRCQWCSDEYGMELKAGAWQWARPKPEGY